MPEARNTVDRMLPLLAVVATLVTFGVSGMAALGLINGVTTTAAAESIPGILTPASYSYTIWAPIAVGLLAFSIYQALPGKLERFRAIRYFYILACLSYSAWVYFLHNGQGAASMRSLAFAWLALLFIETRRGCGTFTETLVVQAPFGIFFGWITALIMAYLDGLYVNFGGGYINAVSCILIFAATLAAILARVKLGNFFFPLAIAWALTAIAIRQGTNTPIVVAAAFGVVICLITTGSFVVNLRDSTSE
jgi:translocator protein